MEPVKSMLQTPIEAIRKAKYYPLEILFSFMVAFFTHQIYLHSSLTELLPSIEALQLPTYTDLPSFFDVSYTIMNPLSIIVALKSPVGVAFYICLYTWTAVAALIFYSEFMNHFSADVIYNAREASTVKVTVTSDAIIKSKGLNDLVRTSTARKSKRLAEKMADIEKASSVGSKAIGVQQRESKRHAAM